MNPEQRLTPINYGGSVPLQQVILALEKFNAEQRELAIAKRRFASTGSNPDQWAVTGQENKLSSVREEIEKLLSDAEKQQLLEPGNYILITETINNESAPFGRPETIIYALFLMSGTYRLEMGRGHSTLDTKIRLALAGTPYDDGMPYGGTRPIQ